jgi:hypothetical protein
MQPGAAVIARALSQGTLTGGLLPGVTALWWRTPTCEEEDRHRGLIEALGQPLDEDGATVLLDFCLSLVVGWWGRAEGEDDLTPIGDPIPCRMRRGVCWPDQPLPWLPVELAEGHHDVLIYAVTRAIQTRALASRLIAIAGHVAPPEGCIPVPTCLGFVGVRLAHWPRLARHPEVRLRCLGAALAPWRDGEDGEQKRPDWLLLMGDVAAFVGWRISEARWVPCKATALAGGDGDLWVGSLTAADVAALWRAALAPALDAAAVVRDWLPVRGEGDALPPLPSASAEPWLDDEAYQALGAEARSWARAAWAHALTQQAAALGRPVVG